MNNTGSRDTEWLTYIHPARNEEEQNMEAYLKNGQVFYRTLRIVKAEEELLVWYSKDFCQITDIPEVKTSQEQGTLINIFLFRFFFRLQLFVLRFCASVSVLPIKYIINLLNNKLAV